MTLPNDVRVVPLVTHGDVRGRFTELLRMSGVSGPTPIQWNAVESQRNVLRGVHVHIVHWDYFFLVRGEMQLGLHDMRPESTTYRLSAMIRLVGSELCGVTIPPGVAHGFY